MKIETTRFGRITVPAERIFNFPLGLIGMEELKGFALLDSTHGPSIQWLQALDAPDIAFLVSEPKTFIPSFEIKLPESELQHIYHGAQSRPNSLKILTILYVDRVNRLLHINVQAPILLDLTTCRGVQAVTDSDIPTIKIPLKTP